MLLTRLILAVCLTLAPALARACDTALILTIDVSNSVDVAEYRLQTNGLAQALEDPDVIEAMVAGASHIAVVQWSGADRQEISIPWTPIRSALDVQSLSQRARLLERAFVLSDTAPAEAINFSLQMFADVPQCLRRVIDISGDGTPNAGANVREARARAERQGVTINAIAIESLGVAITNFYREAVITRDGFVMTARTHREYPQTLRKKILRELSQILG
ncbi:MAG: DUF1194 domain-containing protein [Yoonia sp.]|uniref:DUF1194 domain-containing protein n=1 Tax=Yoonia sp. TaxID=2212373 RepID=UPI003EF6E93D